MSVFSDHLRETLAWHFDPRTGSPFWLQRKDSLGFDPATEVNDLADLRRFPDVSDDLRSVPAEQLIPAGSRSMSFDVLESGGTTGAPKRIVDSTARLKNADWVSDLLTKHGFPVGGNWLHIGPSGPHVVGRTIRYLAQSRGGLFFTVDLDPRWVKRLLGSGRVDLANEYREHILDQVSHLVESQNIKVMFVTPPLLESICARSSLYQKIADSVEAILWAGTSISEESLYQIENTFFANSKVAAIYGNTMMGIAPQRLRGDGDPHSCVFRPFWPCSVVELVDSSTGASVGYGQRGQVLVHHLSRDFFLPNMLERDTAIRVRPAHGDDVDGLADIAPVREANSAPVIEGVY